MKSIFVVATLFWTLYVQAGSCPTDRTAALKEALRNLQKDLEPQTTLNWDVTRKAEEIMVQLNDLEKVPDITVARTTAEAAQTLAEKQMVAIRAQVQTVRKSIEQSLPEPDGFDLVNAIRKSFNDGVASIDLAQPIGAVKTALDQSKHQVIRMRAYTQMAEDSLRSVDEVQRLLQDRCRNDVSFATKIDGQGYEFAGCIPVNSIEDLEAETWGGKMPAGGCRHVVTCSDMKGPQGAFMGGFWVLDCKKRDNTCPNVSACATQIQAAEGQVQPGLKIKRKGSSR